MPVFRTIFALLLGCALLGFSPNAGADLSESREALQTLSDNVKFFRLDNGLRVIMYHRGIAPVFTGAVVVRVGGVDETPGITGIAHMLEHMAFKGTPDLGTTDYQREKALLQQLEALKVKEADGASLSAAEQARAAELNRDLESIWVRSQLSQEVDKRGGVNMNAMTMKDTTQFYVALPSNQFDFWCWMESERILNPVMRQFYEERDVVLEERRMRYEDDPVGRLIEGLLGTAYAVHPYRYPIIGFEQDLRRVTATKVEAFRRKYYVPSNMVIGIVGDVHGDTDIETVRRYFGRIPAAPAPARTFTPEPPQSRERTLVIEGAYSPQLFLAFHKPVHPDPDAAPLSVMLETLAGGKTSPLYREVVINRRVATTVGYSEEPGEAYPNLALIFGAARQPHTNQELIDSIYRVVEEFKRKGVSTAELERVKRQLAVAYLRSLKSNATLAMDMAENEVLFNDWRASITWYDELMRVSVDDVKRVAQKYLVKESRTVGRIERKR